jgi:quinol monooxygenase YgiN
MIVRIVRMQFVPERIEDFKKTFNNAYTNIRNFDGCRFLSLYQDEKDATVFYTISKWEHPDQLEGYRNSDLFRQTWAITRSFFSGPPQAYSLIKNIEDPTNPF